MAFRSLAHFAQELESAGELIRVNQPVSPKLEITEIADRFVKNNGKALLFENNGTAFPVLINLMASDRRICKALGVGELDEIEGDISSVFSGLTTPRSSFFDKLKILPHLRDIASWFPVTRRQRGACQDVIMDPPDLSKLPVLTCWPYDGGPFITLPCVHTIDPETGLRNLGMYRMQVFGPTLTGMHWHMHKGAASHYLKYRKIGKRMPVSVTLGGDPAYIYAATAPLPENVDEYLLAGFLRKKKVEMVKCLTNDLMVPSDVDFVIEGYVDPQEDLILEGPFGDHTGFYSLADYYPRFHVTCITHRKNAIYPTTIVGIPPQEDGWIGKATERIFIAPIRMTIAPEIADMHMPVEGVFHNITLVSIHVRYPGHASKIINSLWGAGQMMFNKILIVFDSTSDLKNYPELLKTLVANTDPVNDIHFMHGPMDVLDHASRQFAYGSKVGVDATAKTTGNQIFSSDFTRFKPDYENLAAMFPEITRIGTHFLERNVPVLILAIRKSKIGHTRELASQLFKGNRYRMLKFLVFVDEFVDVSDSGQIVWLVANNLDPLRDCFYPEVTTGENSGTLCIDGTSKSSEMDAFHRDWPNVITMDKKTIDHIDHCWDQLGLGPFIQSPTLKYQLLPTNPGAVSKRNRE